MHIVDVDEELLNDEAFDVQLDDQPTEVEELDKLDDQPTPTTSDDDNKENVDEKPKQNTPSETVSKEKPEKKTE